MASPLAEDRVGILSFNSHGVSRNTGASAVCTPYPSGLVKTEAREEVV